MRFILITIITLLLFTTGFSQTVKVRSAGNGKAKISRGKVQSIINLNKDIAGCLWLYDATEKIQKKTDATEFELIDAVKKGNSTYVVLLATAGGNCNVQGQCGATEAYTLFWLKLNSSLKVQAKKAVVVEDCLDDLNLTENSAPIKMKDGKLEIEFDDNLYHTDLEYTFSNLIYTRSEAEKGFIVKTEKRPRPDN